MLMLAPQTTPTADIQQTHNLVNPKQLFSNKKKENLVNPKKLSSKKRNLSNGFEFEIEMLERKGLGSDIKIESKGSLRNGFPTQF